MKFCNLITIGIKAYDLEIKLLTLFIIADRVTIKFSFRG